MPRCSLCHSSISSLEPRAIYVLASYHPEGLLIAVCRDCLMYEMSPWGEPWELKWKLRERPEDVSHDFVFFVRPDPQPAQDDFNGDIWWVYAIRKERVPAPDALARDLAVEVPRDDS